MNNRTMNRASAHNNNNNNMNSGRMLSWFNDDNNHYASNQLLPHNNDKNTIDFSLQRPSQFLSQRSFSFADDETPDCQSKQSQQRPYEIVKAYQIRNKNDSDDDDDDDGGYSHYYSSDEESSWCLAEYDLPKRGRSRKPTSVPSCEDENEEPTSTKSSNTNTMSEELERFRQHEYWQGLVGIHDSLHQIRCLSGHDRHHHRHHSGRRTPYGEDELGIRDSLHLIRSKQSGMRRGRRRASRRSPQRQPVQLPTE